MDSLPELKIEEELIDDEPKNTTRNNESLDDAPSGWGERRQPDASSDTSHADEQPRRALGQSFTDIAKRSTVGQYPAVESIVRQHPERYAPCINPTHDCAQYRQQRPEQNTDEGTIATPRGGYVGNDVRPSVKERVYGLEKQEAYITHTVEGLGKDVHHLANTVAYKQDVKERLSSVYQYVDQKIAEVSKPIAELQNKHGVRDVIYLVWLIVSTLANVILLYTVFVIKP